MEVSNMVNKKSIIALFVLLAVSTCFSQSLGTRASIKEKEQFWELDKGLAHGVKVGMDGYFLKKSQAGAKASVQKVAHFKVVKVFKSTSQATVEWVAGFFPKDAQWAQFTATLPNAGGNEQSPTPRVETPPAKSKRALIENAEAAFNKNDYDKAIVLYDQWLAQSPNDPEAQKGKLAAIGHSSLQKGNDAYEKGNEEDAYKFYIEAIKSLKGKDLFAAAERVLDLWDKNESFYTGSAQYGADAKELFQAILEHCGRLLENNLTERALLTLTKLRKYAKDTESAAGIDLLMEKFIDKKIQGDLEKKNFGNIINIIETAVSEENFNEAALYIDKIKTYPLDDELKGRLDKLTELLKTKKEEIQLQEVIRSKEQTLKELVERASTYRHTRKYDDAIKCYLDILAIEPDNQEYRKSLTEIQEEKHEYDKKQNEIKAQLERNSFILKAKDYFKGDLIADALNFYILAYKAFPEQGEAVSGIAQILEKCDPDELKSVTIDPLETKQNIFIKDFLSYVEKTYLAAKDETGFLVMSKVFFNRENKDYVALLERFRYNLYNTNLKKGDEAFKNADFQDAENSYRNAHFYIDSLDVADKIEVSGLLIVHKNLINGQNKSQVKRIIKEQMLTNKNRKEILLGLLYLSEKYMENNDFDRSKFAFELVGDNSSMFPELISKISNIKIKYKELKKQFKQKKKK
jgi:tetratricopeptide (TPR) repeat protein